MNTKAVTIYLADDDEDDRLIFSEALSEIKGRETKLIAVEDGNKLIQLLAEDREHPDLIFLDLNMPNKNGRETLYLIRVNPELKTLPVIVYSTSTSDLDIDEAFRAGASMYVEKPYSIAHLVKTIEKVCSVDWKACEGKLSKDQFFFPSKVGDNEVTLEKKS